jgi:hypothetical protein
MQNSAPRPAGPGMYSQLVDLYLKVHGVRPTEESLQEFASAALGYRPRPKCDNIKTDHSNLKGQRYHPQALAETNLNVKFNEAAIIDTFKKIHSHQPTQSELLAFTAEIGLQSHVSWCWEEHDAAAVARRQGDYESLRAAALERGRAILSPLRLDSCIASAPAALESRLDRDSARTPGLARAVSGSFLEPGPSHSPTNSQLVNTAGRSSDADIPGGTTSAGRSTRQRLAVTRAWLIALNRSRSAAQEQAHALSEAAQRLSEAAAAIARRNELLCDDLQLPPAAAGRWPPGRVVPLLPPPDHGPHAAPAGRPGPEFPVWHWPHCGRDAASNSDLRAVQTDMAQGRRARPRPAAAPAALYGLTQAPARSPRRWGAVETDPFSVQWLPESCGGGQEVRHRAWGVSSDSPGTETKLHSSNSITKSKSFPTA